MRKGLVALMVLLTLGAAAAWALEYRDLYAHLPDLPGLKGQPPSGSSIKAFGGLMLQAQRLYQASPQRTLEAQIHIGPAVTMMWMPFSIQVSYDNPEERLDTVSVEGFPAKLIWHKKEKRGELYVLLSEKGQAKALFTLQFQGFSWEEIQKFLPHFRLSELLPKLP